MKYKNPIMKMGSLFLYCDNDLKQIQKKQGNRSIYSNSIEIYFNIL